MLDEFRVFAAVAKHLNITKASMELHMCQSSVSKHVRLLEDAYKLQLYRRRRGVELTERGKLFLRHITPILSQVQQLKEKFRPSKCPGQASRPTPTLKIGVGCSQVAFLLPLLLSLYNKKRPDVEVDIRSGPVDPQIQDLKNGDTDVAILGRKVQSRHFIDELVREESLALFVRPKHPLAKKPAVTLEDLERYAFAVTGGRHRESSSARAVNTLKRSGVNLNVGMRCPSNRTIKAHVTTTNRIGILSRDVILPELRRREFIIVSPPGSDLKGRTYVVFPAGGPKSQQVADFIDTVRCWRKNQQLRRSPISESPQEVVKSLAYAGPDGPPGYVENCLLSDNDFRRRCWSGRNTKGPLGFRPG